MFLRRGKVIEFNGGSEAYVATCEVDGLIHVGFALKEGQSPTNAFERLAEFVWDECFGNRVLSDFRWFDLQRHYFDGDSFGDNDDAFVILPVRLKGTVSRKRLGGILPDINVSDAPRCNDAKSIDGPPIWGHRIAYSSLPIGFKDVVRRNIIVPARELGLVPA